MNTVKIEWKQARPYSIWGKGETLEGAAPKAKLETVLIPGINEIDGKLWENAKKHPNVAHYLNEGELVEINVPTDAGARKKSSKGLLQYGITEAKKLVRQTYDKALLADWKSADNRSGIHQEIDKQIERIDAAARKKTEDEASAPRY